VSQSMRESCALKKSVNLNTYFKSATRILKRDSWIVVRES